MWNARAHIHDGVPGDETELQFGRFLWRRAFAAARRKPRKARSAPKTQYSETSAHAADRTQLALAGRSSSSAEDWAFRGSIGSVGGDW